MCGEKFKPEAPEQHVCEACKAELLELDIATTEKENNETNDQLHINAS